MMVPVAKLQEGCVIFTVGVASASGAALTIIEVEDVHPLLFLTVKV